MSLYRPIEEVDGVELMTEAPEEDGQGRTNCLTHTPSPYRYLVHMRTDLTMQ